MIQMDGPSKKCSEAAASSSSALSICRPQNSWLFSAMACKCCFYALIIYWSDWQASHWDMKNGLLLIFMSSASNFSGCLLGCLVVVWVCFGFGFIYLTCNSSWVFLLPWYGHDFSFQKDVFLLLVTSHTLLFSYPGFLFHFLKSLLLCGMYLLSASSVVSLFTTLPAKV